LAKINEPEYKVEDTNHSVIDYAGKRIPTPPAWGATAIPSMIALASKAPPPTVYPDRASPWGSATPWPFMAFRS